MKTQRNRNAFLRGHVIGLTFKAIVDMSYTGRLAISHHAVEVVPVALAKVLDLPDDLVMCIRLR